MSERTINHRRQELDALRTAGDALALAAQAAREGAADARAKVAEIAPIAGDFLRRVTYTSSYLVSYGVVFPALLAARAIPKNNALVNGLIDGAAAARDSLVGENR